MGATQKVQKKVDGVVIDVVEASSMNMEMQRTTKKQFDLAKSAPATRSSLRQLVGYCTLTQFATDLLKGDVPIPSNVNEPTSQLIRKFQRLLTWLSPKHQPIDITYDNYCYYWGRANEGTSSTISAVHFGHWKVLIKSNYLAQFICTQLNLIAKYGCAPSRWGAGLQVFFEKIPGMSLVNKLQAILLMEGDFNFYYKWVFGHCSINNLYGIGYIPDDQYSQKESTAEDSKLDNKLTMDLSCQL
jgi:hypothetical protein